MPPEATDMMIILKPQSEWKRDVSYDELAEEFEERLNTIPGVFFEKNQPIQMRFQRTYDRYSPRRCSKNIW
jgi:cobalt-zinc-cadmium resistance protein CzcA